MSYLLDTHALLWAFFEPDRLEKKGIEIISNPQLTVFVSVVTFWELSLKYSTGKLDLSGVSPEQFPDLTRQSGFEILQLADYEAATFHRLPRLAHKDPFDRLLIWQSISRKLTLISHDRSFKEYASTGLKIIW